MPGPGQAGWKYREQQPAAVTRVAVALGAQGASEHEKTPLPSRTSRAPHLAPCRSLSGPAPRAAMNHSPLKTALAYECFQDQDNSTLALPSDLRIKTGTSGQQRVQEQVMMTVKRQKPKTSQSSTPSHSNRGKGRMRAWPGGGARGARRPQQRSPRRRVYCAAAARRRAHGVGGWRRGGRRSQGRSRGPGLSLPRPAPGNCLRVLSYPVARGRAPPSPRPILPGLSCGISVAGGVRREGGAWLPDGQGVTETRVEAQEGRAAGEVAQGADKPL